MINKNGWAKRTVETTDDFCDECGKGVKVGEPVWCSYIPYGQEGDVEPVHICSACMEKNHNG